MNRLCFYFFLFFSLVGCKPIYKSVNGINKQINFVSLNDYKNYLNEHTNLDTKKIYFVDNKNYSDLIFDVYKKRIIYYYGIFENNELIADGSNLKDKNSCYGSILKAIDTNSNNTEFIGESNITKFSYFNINKNLVTINLTKKTVVFVYSYKLGKLSKTLEHLINESQENDTLNYIILSLDNADITI